MENRSFIIVAGVLAVCTAVLAFCARGGGARSPQPAAETSIASDPSNHEAQPLSTDAAVGTAKREEVAVEKPGTTASSPKSGAIEVRLAGGSDEAFGRAEFELRSGSQLATRASIDPARGLARFEGLAPAVYTVELDSGSLPPGWLPARETLDSRTRRPIQRVDVLADATSEVVFALEEGAYVFGVVDGIPREALDGVVVTFSNGKRFTQDHLALAPEFAVAPDGTYRGWVRPGKFRVHCGPTGSGSEIEPSNAIPRRGREVWRRLHPLARAWDLAPRSQNKIDFHLAPGPCDVNLRTIDAIGAAVPGLEVAISLTQIEQGDTGVFAPSEGIGAVLCVGSTDGNGSLHFEGLAPSRYGFSVDRGGYNPLAPPGKSKLGQLFECQVFDVVPGVNEIDLRVVVAHPVHVRGQITPRAKDSSAVASLHLILPPRGGRTRDMSLDVTGTPDGAFSFYVDASETDAILVVGRDATALTIPLGIGSEQGEVFLPITYP